MTHGFESVTRGLELITRRFEPVTGISEFVTRDLLFHVVMMFNFFLIHRTNQRNERFLW